MIIRVQLCMFFAFGMLSWGGVASLVAEAKAEQLAQFTNIMTLEQLTEIKVNDI